MNILIYGAGALGQALGCMLTTAGNKVDLIMRQRFIEVIEKNGLHVDGVLGEFRAEKQNLGLYRKIEETEGSYDYVLITTKSYDTAAAVADIARLGEQAENVVSLQNGCGNVEQLVQAFGQQRSLGGRVITGFEITSPGHVHVSVTADAIHIGAAVGGAIPETAQKLAAAIEAAGHPCKVVEDIHLSLHAKLLYNCALNPLGAILGVHYGALADDDETKAVMDSIIEETFAVIGAAGGKTVWSNAEEYKAIFYSTLIPATYSHRASMLQDLENGKPTEVDALVGYVCAKGRESGVATPNCDLIAAMVRFKERQQA